MSLGVTKLAFQRCLKSTVPTAELTNKEMSCVRDLAAAYMSAQAIMNQQGQRSA